MHVKATIKVNGLPLRRAYVEHIVFGVGTEMYMTDVEGSIRDIHTNEGVESLAPYADIRIICQNPICRVLDGIRVNIGVFQDITIQDGDEININTPARQVDHYNILNRVHLNYEVAFRPLRFFQNLPNPDFPLGRKSSLRSTRDRPERIDLSFPDQFAGPHLSFVEPKRLVDNYPLIHIKDDDPRLFGDAGALPTLIPSEVSHALHFSFLTEAQRGRAQDKYLQFIVSSPLTGLGPTHDFDIRTSPEVAYIEALDLFSARFMEFMRTRQGLTSTLVNPEPITPAIHAEFVASEFLNVTESRMPFFSIPLSRRGAIFDRVSGLRGRLFPNFRRLGRRPIVTGGDVEGAVYGAIFVDFASIVGLDFAASSYFAANAITFGEYRTYIQNSHPEHVGRLNEVSQFWGL